MNLFEKLTIAGLAVVAAGSVAGITTTTIIDKKNVEEMNANLLEQINDLQDQINNLNDKTDNLQKQIDELKEEYSALKAKEQADIEAVTNDYTNKIAAIQEQINNLYDYLADLESDYNEKLADLNDELERVEREYKQADASNKATLEARITTINNTIYELNSKYQGEVATINNKIASLTNSINDLEKELDDAIEAIKKEYDEKLKEIEDKIDAVNEAIANINTLNYTWKFLASPVNVYEASNGYNYSSSEDIVGVRYYQNTLEYYMRGTYTQADGTNYYLYYIDSHELELLDGPGGSEEHIMVNYYNNTYSQWMTENVRSYMIWTKPTFMQLQNATYTNTAVYWSKTNNDYRETFDYNYSLKYWEDVKTYDNGKYFSNILCEKNGQINIYSKTGEYILPGSEQNKNIFGLSSTKTLPSAVGQYVISGTFHYSSYWYIEVESITTLAKFTTAIINK